MDERVLNNESNSSLALLADKFELLFNINNQSPIFILIAYKKFLENNLEKSLLIIENGLKKFPNHPTALLLKSKILIKQGNFSQALKLIKKVSSILGTDKTFDFYLNELEVLNKQSIKFDADEKLDDIKDFSFEIKNISEKSLDVNLSKETPPKIETQEKDYNSIDDSLIISDTLAKIYFNQKEYKEALRIYNKLKTKYPEKSAFYESKISEIKALIENS